MVTLPHIDFIPTNTQSLSNETGHIVVFVQQDGTMIEGATKLGTVVHSSLSRFVDSKGFKNMTNGGVHTLSCPLNLQAQALHVIKIGSDAISAKQARAAGNAIAKAIGNTTDPVLLVLANIAHGHSVILGYALRSYQFTRYKTENQTNQNKSSVITVMVDAPDLYSDFAVKTQSIIEGVYFTRDLVNEPANVLTTSEFAYRLEGLRDCGIEVTVLEEKDLHALGMRALLAVGQGSVSPAKAVVMQWQGNPNKNRTPIALVGKGVVFDSGGISIKPSAGMEDMTMDMGGAGVVAGVMRALARSQTKANVVGVVGLVENMPDGNAQRPGDVVTTMKGDTVEVINTDAEGRLVLCDLLWYTQEHFKPQAVIDLATLTGAIIIALGHENAGAFSNDDDFINQFLQAAKDESEGFWRLPLDKAYDKQLKSRIADVKNVGGRAAGSITAAKFLERFIKNDMPWIHLDIAGVSLFKSANDTTPIGANAWGVRSVLRLIQTHFTDASNP